MITVNEQLQIDDSELEFVYSRSPGPGGQNVNKVETKVTLRFAVDASPSLNDDQRRRIRENLATRITRDGILRVVSHRHRTRGANQKAAIERFIELLQDALDEQAPRKKTRTPTWVRRKRLEDKQRRAQVKKQRSKPQRWDE